MSLLTARQAAIIPLPLRQEWNRGLEAAIAQLEESEVVVERVRVLYSVVDFVAVVRDELGFVHTRLAEALYCAIGATLGDAAGVVLLPLSIR